MAYTYEDAEAAFARTYKGKLMTGNDGVFQAR